MLEAEGCSLPRDRDGRLLPSYKNPNAIFVGELSARDSTQIPGKDAANQYVMADAEIQSALAGGLPGGPGGASRPLVRVTCETGDDLNVTSAHAKHLVDVVNAPVVISMWNNHAVTVHTAVVESKKSVLEYCMVCSTDVRRFAAGSGDVSTIYSGTAAGVDIAPGIAAKATELENKVKAKPGFSGNVRLAVLITSDLVGSPPQQTREEVLKTLRFNGKLASENSTDDYRSFEYTDTSDRTALAKQVAQFAPHIIIPITVGEANRSLLAAIEANWTAAIHPEYVGSVGQQQPSMVEVVSGNEDLRKRNVIVNLTPSPTDPQRLLDWQSNYQQRFSSPSSLAPIGYDAYWAVAYAIVGAGQTSKLTGADIVRGLLKLKGGTTKYFVGPGGIGGMNEIQNGPIDLSGLVVTMNFNADTGRIPFPKIPILCIGRSANGLAFSPTGQIFNVAQATLDGTYNCPGG